MSRDDYGYAGFKSRNDFNEALERHITQEPEWEEALICENCIDFDTCDLDPVDCDRIDNTEALI